MAKKQFNFIDNYIYFYHLDAFAVIPTYPDSIADSMKSTFISTNALARSAPVFSYAYSGPRVVDITLNLHRDLMHDVNTDVGTLKQNVVGFTEKAFNEQYSMYYNKNSEVAFDYVGVLIKLLQTIVVPKYDASKSVIPPMIAVKFGEEVFIKGVVSNVSVNYSKPILSDGKYAQATVTFSISEVDPYDALSIAKDGSFRGITKAFKSGIWAEVGETKEVPYFEPTFKKGITRRF